MKLNLNPTKKTKTGLSTNVEVLEGMKNDGVEIAEYILDYRKLSKLKNTYVDALPKLIDNNDRLHTTFNQIGTTTGRLSSSNPNLQNIPVKTDEGIKIRQGFIAEEGNLLMGIDYRKLSKLKNTYVDALPKLIDNNNRIHTTFNQIGTTTGRLSSSNPNLQNIPVKTDEGIKIRQGFIADEGNLLMGIDYSQIELRVLAELSKDENLISAYKRGEDLHKVTAKKIFELGEDEEVSREQRIIAKTINFSIIYGKTAFGLSKGL